MMKAKIIASEEEYQAALAYLDTLMDAAPGSAEEDELELFTMLVERYEKEHYPIAPPDPVDAILFRMDQLGLARSDLTPYMGSQSKVSEVLNRRRPLSLAMIRALHEGLGIPAEVLVQAPAEKAGRPQPLLSRYPFRDMLRMGFFGTRAGSPPKTRVEKENLIQALVGKMSAYPVERAYCRTTQRAVNEHALQAWQARAWELAEDAALGPYEPARLSEDFLRELIHLSVYASGPLMVKEHLEQLGVAFIILPHLLHTYLDGACFMTPSGLPVIGLTLRHDRLDNFWFTVAHELAHLFLHLKDQSTAFFDDMEHAITGECSLPEQEADRMAADLLIPAELWAVEKDNLLQNRREVDIRLLADRLKIHPAIIAGRMRWELKDYSLFARLVNGDGVKQLFMEAAVTA